MTERPRPYAGLTNFNGETGRQLVARQGHAAVLGTLRALAAERVGF